MAIFVLCFELYGEDSYGLPIEFYITSGEVHDSKATPTLIVMLPSSD